ncbi:hypothetical protein D3C85_652580 [compost metagenome]
MPDVLPATPMSTNGELVLALLPKPPSFALSTPEALQLPLRTEPPQRTPRLLS